MRIKFTLLISALFLFSLILFTNTSCSKKSTGPMGKSLHSKATKRSTPVKSNIRIKNKPAGRQPGPSLM